MGKLIFVGGGVRSGKSAFAVEKAMALGKTRGFIATAEMYDDEMRARARAHQAERGAKFVTVEEPVNVVAALSRLSLMPACEVVVMDCLTLWLSNLMLRDVPARAIQGHVEELLAAIEKGSPTCIVVSNEVGMGVVPESALGRAFRDVAGKAHQAMARAAGEVYLGMMGLVMRAKPGPVMPVGMAAADQREDEGAGR